MRSALAELHAGRPAAAAMDFEALKAAVGFPEYYAEEARYRPPAAMEFEELKQAVGFPAYYAEEARYSRQS